jgi:hypothetical protein
MQLLFSFDWSMRVEKTLMQTLASQLSSTLMQLLFSFDWSMRVEKTLMQTLASQLSSTLVQLLFLFNRGMRVRKLSCEVQTPALLLSSTLFFVWPRGLTKIKVCTVYKLTCLKVNQAYYSQLLDEVENFFLLLNSPTDQLTNFLFPCLHQIFLNHKHVVM